jgi:DNA-binding transcriptional regulator YhcF (GntR family)
VEEEATSSPSDSTPPYLHIADVLRGEILDGVFRVGARIPSQAELESRFQVSRPTVQRALGELRKGGFIDNHRGRPSEVLPWRERGTSVSPIEAKEPEPAFASLATHIEEAFRRPRITIDAYSLTAETLNAALTLQVQQIRSGRPKPESIHVRVLLPSQDAQLAIPRLAADPDDDRPLRRLRQLVRGHGITLRTSMYGLGGDVESSVEFRTVPITPLHKLYLINGEVALFGHYRVIKRPVRFSDGQSEDIFDVLGVDATLFPHRRDPGDPHCADSRFVAESYAWFDSLWQTIAEPLTLAE